MNDLIYCQTKIPRDQWRYGFRSSAATGCGWIAIYNALALLGYTIDPKKLIRTLEGMLPLIHGNCGTTIPAPFVCFRHWGFPCRLHFRTADFDDAAQDADVCILFYRWRRGMKLGAHFVTVTHRDGEFIGYNTYKNSSGPDRYGPSLSGFLKSKGYFAPALLTIRHKPSESKSSTAR